MSPARTFAYATIGVIVTHYKVIAAAVVAIVVLLLVASGGNGEAPAAAAPAPAPAAPAPSVAPNAPNQPLVPYEPYGSAANPYEVKYQASSSGGTLALRYTTQGGVIVEEPHVRGEWTTTVERTDLAGGQVAIRDTSGDPRAVVSCQVTVDGFAVQNGREGVAYGPYSAVVCGGVSRFGSFG